MDLVKLRLRPAEDNTDTLAAFDLVKMSWVFGGILILAGIAVAFVIKNPYWAGILIGFGIAIPVLTYLLVQYAIYFLFGISILLVFGGWLVYKHFFVKKALDETVKLVDVAKKTGVIDEDKFHDLAKADNPIQSEKTQEIVAEVRGK